MKENKGEMVVADRFHIALFSALEQTHCARVVSKQYKGFFCIHVILLVASMGSFTAVVERWSYTLVMINFVLPDERLQGN